MCQAVKKAKYIYFINFLRFIFSNFYARFAFCLHKFYRMYANILLFAFLCKTVLERIDGGFEGIHALESSIMLSVSSVMMKFPFEHPPLVSP